MARGRGNAVVLALALFALVRLVAAKDYIVGDATQWDYPPGTQTTFYDDWAAKQTFAVGDNLVFKYATGAHDMQVVSDAEYAGCMMSNGKKYTSGSDTFALSKAGDYHFLCSFISHCDMGMKMKVTVGGAAATPPTATPPTATPPIATPPPATPPPATPPRAATPPVKAPTPAPVRTPPAPAPAPVPAIAPTAPDVAPTPPLIVPVTPVPAATPEPVQSSAQATRVCLSLLVASAAVLAVLF